MSRKFHADLTISTSKNHISALNILITAAFIEVIYIVKIYQIYVLSNEHKNTWLNLCRSVPLMNVVLYCN